MSKPGPPRQFDLKTSWECIPDKHAPLGFSLCCMLHIDIPPINVPTNQPVTDTIFESPQPHEGKYFTALPQPTYIPPDEINWRDHFYFPGVSEYVQEMDEIANNPNLTFRQRKRRRQKAKHRYKKYLERHPSQGTCNYSHIVESEVKNGS